MPCLSASFSASLNTEYHRAIDYLDGSRSSEHGPAVVRTTQIYRQTPSSSGRFVTALTAERSTTARTSLRDSALELHLGCC